jgi:hypothetical protein
VGIYFTRDFSKVDVLRHQFCEPRYGGTKAGYVATYCIVSGVLSDIPDRT